MCNTYRKKRQCALYTGGKCALYTEVNVHYIHLNEVKKYCLVEGWMHHLYGQRLKIKVTLWHQHPVGLEDEPVRIWLSKVTVTSQNI